MSETPDPGVLRRLRRALGRMSPSQREIFLVHRLDGLSYEEIAVRTGLSVERVERHMARAISKIARSLAGRKVRWWERFF